jgi:GABA(A) receptor-associated protein
MVESQFKSKFSLEDRKQESLKMVEKYKDKIPVIVDKLPSSTLKDLDRKKFLLPNDILVSQFHNVIRNRLKLSPSEAIFVFFGSNQSIAIPSTPMSQVYEQNKDEDGFLYCYYTSENTFGN